MDRQIVYPGSIPLDTDFLTIQRNTLSAIGFLGNTILGSSPVADGLACFPAGGFAVAVGVGSLSTTTALDPSAYGSLAADPTPVVKTGVITTNTVLQLGTAPDQGTVLCWLIQATLQDIDDLPLTLQYWNAANPELAYSGPGNSGSAQNTRRRTILLLSAKASSPLPVGTFAPPSADAGWIGLYGVTTWIGKSGITPDDIRAVPGAPFLSFHLPDLAPGFSRQEVIVTSGGWTVPQGVRRLRVRAVGAGGGGGGGTPNFGGGGGGAGGYAESILAVQPGQTYPVTIGTGGSSAPPSTTGGAGGTTQFGDSIIAQGGAGGASANPDSHGGAGGGGVAGMLLVQGGMGTDGASVSGVPAGNGGASVFGGGGRGSNGGGAPADGKAPGSGAGGAYGTNASGGFGSAGLVLLEY